MKRIISTILVCVLLLGCVLTLASCGKRLSGTYAGKLEVAGQSAEMSFTFKGNKVTMETKGTVLGITTSTSLEGTYEIEDDKITITYEEDGKSVTDTMTFEKGKDFIKLDGIQFDKVKK